MAARGSIGGLTVLAWLIALAAHLAAAPIAVLFSESASRGFVRLRDDQGKIIADGQTWQRRSGNRLTARLVFQFRDGSRFDETTVYTQQRQFHLVSEHVIQRGPAFPESSDLLIDAASGMVRVRYTDDGKAKEAMEHFDLPPDLANGIVPTLLKNAGGATAMSFPYVAATPKPRLITLDVTRVGTDRVTAGGLSLSATHYVVKANLGGVAGVVAPLIGKQPPDSHAWILDGPVPMFVRAQQPFFSGAPLWTIDLVAPGMR